MTFGASMSHNDEVKKRSKNYVAATVIRSKRDITFPGKTNMCLKFKENLKRLIFLYFGKKGTKWCGPGNTASHYHDLGLFRKTDACCRDHDHCDHITGHSMKYDFENPYPFSLMACECEKNFRNCLRKNIGLSTIFNVLYFTSKQMCFVYQNGVKVMPIWQYISKHNWNFNRY